MTDVEQGLGLLLVQLCRAHRNLVAGALEALHVHVGQEHAVYRLAIQQGLTQAQLAEALCVDASTVTKMLRRLERWSLVQPVVDIWRRAEARLLAGMTEAEQELLRRLLRQMLSNLA